MDFRWIVLQEKIVGSFIFMNKSAKFYKTQKWRGFLKVIATEKDEKSQNRCESTIYACPLPQQPKRFGRKSFKQSS